MSSPGPIPLEATGGRLNAVACPSPVQCTAVDDSGQEVTFNPAKPHTAATTIAIDAANNTLFGPSGALRREELLDPDVAHFGDGQSTRFEPPAEPRDLPQLIDRRQRRMAAAEQFLPIRVRERSHRPRHQHPADPGPRPGHPLLLLPIPIGTG